MAAEWIKLPANIKQELQPFKIGGGVSAKASQSSDVKGEAQLFTFRDSSKEGYKLGTLGVCPKSFFYKADNDLSFKLLFGRDASTGKMTSDSVELSKYLMNAVPAIKIREFQCDTPLNELLNFVTRLQEITSELKVSSDDKIDETAEQQKPQDNKNIQPEGKEKSLAKAIENAAKWLIKYFTCSEDLKGKNLAAKLESSLDSVKDQAMGAMSSGDADHANYIMKMPFFFYYTFLSSTTLNIYEFPCKLENDLLYSSDGTPGWGGTAFDLQILQDKIRAVSGAAGAVADALLGNIRMMYLAPWNAMEGWKTNDTDIQLKVHLFNDTIETAVTNFVCVNTLIGNNKYAQYGVFQTGPSLYDVQVEGSNRLFACTGKFQVVAKGPMREPPYEFFKKLIENKGSHVSMSVEQLIQAKKIKIPDVYEVTMTFSSCLPATFNSWLFQYSNNMKIDKSQGGYKPSAVVKAITDVVEDVTNKVKEYWPDSWPGDNASS